MGGDKSGSSRGGKKWGRQARIKTADLHQTALTSKESKEMKRKKLRSSWLNYRRTVALGLLQGQGRKDIKFGLKVDSQKFLQGVV